MSSKLDLTISEDIDISNELGDQPVRINADLPKETPSQVKQRILKTLKSRDFSPELLKQRTVMSLKPEIPTTTAALFNEAWQATLQKIWREAFNAAILSYKGTLFEDCFKENARRSKDGSYHIPVHTNPKSNQERVLQKGLNRAFFAHAERALQELMRDSFMGSPAEKLLVFESFSNITKHFILINEVPAPTGMHAFDCVDYYQGKKVIFIYINFRSAQERERCTQKIRDIHHHIDIGTSGNNSNCAYFIVNENNWQTLIDHWEAWDRNHPLLPKDLINPDEQETMV